MEENNKFKKLEESLQKELKETGYVIRDGKLTTYKTILHEGYLGDFTTEYWTEIDWEKHRKHVEELKRKGTYGKPWICELTLMHDPVLDRPGKCKAESYKYEMINFK